MIKNRVSIIIPCFNHEMYLSDCLASVKAQTHEDIEIIIVDDGSHPVINRRNYEDWIIIIRQENKGLPAARNAGIKEASGEWILPLDADDKIAPTCVAKMLAATESAHIISSGITMFGNRKGYKEPPPAPKHKDFLMRNQINCCSLFSKAMWEKIGGYDERMRDGYEDWGFWLKATKAGYTVKTINEPLFFYRKRGNSLLTNAQRNKPKILQYMKQQFPTIGLTQ
jgi:glycosyltransferase involved in cell wall biosynthesis